MATERCKKCGSLVEARAKKCHICGAKMVRTTRLVKFLSVVFAGFLLITCYGALNSRHPTAPSTSPAVATDEQIKAAEEKRLMEYAKSSESAPYGTLPVSTNAPIRDGALQEYTKATHPKLHKAWNDAGFQMIEQQQRLAADLVAKSGRCDAIDTVGLAIDRSKPPSSPVTMVLCENGLKFYLGDKDLSGPPRAEADLAISEDKAVSLCRDMVRSDARFPSSVDFKFGGTGSDTNQSSGAVSVVASFEAKNGLGIVIPRQAFCTFSVDGPPTIKISDR